MVRALATSANLEYENVKGQADETKAWAEGKTAEDVAAALRGEGDSAISKLAKAAKADDYWLYTRFFGIGLIKLMEVTGTEATNDVMQKWVKEDLAKSSQKAEADLDQWNALNSKLVMMEVSSLTCVWEPEERLPPLLAHLQLNPRPLSPPPPRPATDPHEGDRDPREEEDGRPAGGEGRRCP